MPSRVLSLRIPQPLREQLHDQAAAEGVTDAAWVRAVVLEALDRGAEGRPEHDIADRDEVLALLTASARRGDVQAAKALLAAQSAKAGPSVQPSAEPAAPPADPLDEIAARRHRKSA